jgi:hypothetical protein
MPRLELTGDEWRAIARELGSTGAAPAPPGLAERIHALLAQAPHDWPEQAFTLELDPGSAEAVQLVYARLTGNDRDAGQRAASVSEAIQLIHDHQRREEGN